MSESYEVYDVRLTVRLDAKNPADAWIKLADLVWSEGWRAYAESVEQHPTRTISEEKVEA